MFEGSHALCGNYGKYINLLEKNIAYNQLPEELVIWCLFSTVLMH